MKTRFTLRSLIATTTCVAILIATFLWLIPRVTVTVRNSGTTPLHDLQVHVTGQTYGLGDVAGGTLKKCTVRPTSDSHVEISYCLTDGTTKQRSR